MICEWDDIPAEEIEEFANKLFCPLPNLKGRKEENLRNLKKGDQTLFVLGKLIGDLVRISSEVDELAAEFVGVDYDIQNELDDLISRIDNIVTITIKPKLKEYCFDTDNKE